MEEKERWQPVISCPNVDYGKKYCDLCSSLGAGQGVKDFAFGYHGNTTWTLTLCKECAEKVAHFLLRSWKD